MSKFEVIRGVEGYCLALDDTRVAGPKPWGGGTVIHAWETDKEYRAERTCSFKTIEQFINSKRSRGDICECTECGYTCARGFVIDEHFLFCPNCGARVVKR